MGSRLKVDAARQPQHVEKNLQNILGLNAHWRLGVLREADGNVLSGIDEGKSGRGSGIGFILFCVFEEWDLPYRVYS